LRLPRLWYCDHHELPLPPGHKFPVQKYALLRDRLVLDTRFTFAQAPFAAAEAIERAHDPAYVQAFLNGTLDPRIIRRIGFPWSEGLVRRTLASVGGTLRATEDALATGWGGTLAGGTHHAFYAEGSGFCVFNDLAIAIRSAARRASIIDLDVHQGDGTAAIFAGDPSVFTLSLHGGNNFPFRKQESKLDIALPDGTRDDGYLSALVAALPKAFGHGPEIAFYQSGVDALASDKLGRLDLTPDGLRQRDQMVFEACRTRGIPCVVTLGGGYSDPIELTVAAHAVTFRTAADLFG
jgi:acetoin utilization deacetylase AcuC-like enzyme